MENNDKDDNNTKYDKDDKGISALPLDRDLGVSPGHQGHRPPDDDEIEDNHEIKDNDEIEDNDEVEENDKANDNYKDDNNDEGISGKVIKILQNLLQDNSRIEIQNSKLSLLKSKF